ncbi:hypothetical protein MNBD_NITROSPIRAE03-287, partial [hydrothermal vent metagenome]
VIIILYAGKMERVDRFESERFSVLHKTHLDGDGVILTSESRLDVGTRMSEDSILST